MGRPLLSKRPPFFCGPARDALGVDGGEANPAYLEPADWDSIPRITGVSVDGAASTAATFFK